MITFVFSYAAFGQILFFHLFTRLLLLLLDLFVLINDIDTAFSRLALSICFFFLSELVMCACILLYHCVHLVLKRYSTLIIQKWSIFSPSFIEGLVPQRIALDTALERQRAVLESLEAQSKQLASPRCLDSSGQNQENLKEKITHSKKVATHHGQTADNHGNTFIVHPTKLTDIAKKLDYSLMSDQEGTFFCILMRDQKYVSLCFLVCFNEQITETQGFTPFHKGEHKYSLKQHTPVKQPIKNSISDKSGGDRTNVMDKPRFQPLPTTYTLPHHILFSIIIKTTIRNCKAHFLCGCKLFMLYTMFK